jgi:hypothetical protein
MGNEGRMRKKTMPKEAKEKWEIGKGETEIKIKDARRQNKKKNDEGRIRKRQNREE